MTDCPNLDCRECHPLEVACDKCGSVIPRNIHHLLEGGMRVDFQGWYGGSIDPLGRTDVTLCDGCAKDFLHVNQWLGHVYADLEA